MCQLGSIKSRLQFRDGVIEMHCGTRRGGMRVMGLGRIDYGTRMLKATVTNSILKGRANV